eukprot:6594442-Prymnesium_polylepis.1
MLPGRVTVLGAREERPGEGSGRRSAVGCVVTVVARWWSSPAPCTGRHTSRAPWGVHDHVPSVGGRGRGQAAVCARFVQKGTRRCVCSCSFTSTCCVGRSKQSKSRASEFRASPSPLRRFVIAHWNLDDESSFTFWLLLPFCFWAPRPVDPGSKCDSVV